MSMYLLLIGAIIALTPAAMLFLEAGMALCTVQEFFSAVTPLSLIWLAGSAVIIYTFQTHAIKKCSGPGPAAGSFCRVTR